MRRMKVAGCLRRTEPGRAEAGATHWYPLILQNKAEGTRQVKCLLKRIPLIQISNWWMFVLTLNISSYLLKNIFNKCWVRQDKTELHQIDFLVWKWIKLSMQFEPGMQTISNLINAEFFLLVESRKHWIIAVFKRIKKYSNKFLP